MKHYLFNRTRWILGVLGLSAAACHGVLDVTDPTHISDSDIANASGANGRRLNAASVAQELRTLYRDVALLTDEWSNDEKAGVVFGRELAFDQRNSTQIENFGQGENDLGPLTQAFIRAGMAIPVIRAYTPDSLRGDFLAQMYALRAFAVVQMAEDFCAGFPLNDVVNDVAVYGGPLTTDSALTIASAQADSALAYVHDSTRFFTLAHVIKGRILLDQGDFDGAAAAVVNVATTDVYTSESYVQMSMSRTFCVPCFSNIALGDREGTNGLPFVSANDPRIPVVFFGVRKTNPQDSLWVTTLATQPDFRLTFASGVEARLIQSEAAIHHDDPTWKSILDSLRATVGLGPLTDPGTLNTRIDVLYSERAFWLFMDGHRLGDLRRLIARYGRNAEDVFPTGPYRGGGSGGNYGTATSLAFGFADQKQYNPYITAGCTDGP